MFRREDRVNRNKVTNGKMSIDPPFLRCSLAICLVAFGCHPAAAQQRRAPSVPRTAAPQENFEQVKEKADQAREAGDLEAAITLYRKAVTIRPGWVDGWWYLATILYDKDQYAEAARAFKQTVSLQPKVGAPPVMLGLCEFRLGDYDNALKHLQQGRRLGIGDNQELSRVMRFHEGLLMLVKGEFETAQRIFDSLSYDNMNQEDLIIAHGLASLRLAMLPSQVNKDYGDREVIRRAGFAQHQVAQKNMGDAQREYDRLVADYPKAPNVQYAYGLFMSSQRNDEGAIAAFQREIENSPKHALARLYIAYIRLRNKEAADGLPFAQEAVTLHPRLPLSHYILGRLLFETGETGKAVEELEAARRLAPEEPKIHFALSRAYIRAGRKKEAEQAREIFARLNKAAEDAAAQGVVRGEVIEEEQEKAKPDSP